MYQKFDECDLTPFPRAYQGEECLRSENLFPQHDVN
ncbi:hypothetical protein Riv7116_5462 [Rivularia sp. PCC 7116]|nr:hypothetical protein Riv7116_5462 [Rivularia sp. PCC 7116]